VFIYLGLSVTDLDDSVARSGCLCLFLSPSPVSISNHLRSDTYHGFKSLELHVIVAKDLHDGVLESSGPLTVLVLLNVLDKLLVGGIRSEILDGGHLGGDGAAERILIDVVHTLNTDDTVVDEHTEKKEEETAELEVRPVTPDLTEARIRTKDNVEDEEVGNPDASATETLKDGTKNSRSVLSNEHTKEVVAKDDRGIKNTSAKDVAIVEEHVKSFKSLLTTNLLRDVGGEAKEDGAGDGTPEALKTDNKDGVKLDVLQKVLLNDDLRSLDDLSDNDERAAKSGLSLGVSLGAGGRRVILGQIRGVKGSESDDEKRESDDANTSPVRGMELTLKEEL